jgi:hypothetical protein
MVCQGIWPCRLFDTSVPEDCPQHLLVKDISTRNNTDDSGNKTVEANYEGGTYYYSTAQDPSQNTSVYGSSDKFALVTLQRSAYGGRYAKNADMKIENILPFAFPLGIGCPQMKRVNVSLEICIQVYVAFLETIYRRANFSSHESHLQQANVIQE